MGLMWGDLAGGSVRQAQLKNAAARVLKGALTSPATFRQPWRGSPASGGGAVAGQHGHGARKLRAVAWRRGCASSHHFAEEARRIACAGANR